MSTELDEMQFEILPSPDAPAGVVFGIGADVSVDEDGFIPGDDEWETEDETNPRRGGTAFGRDALSGPTWGWNLHVNASDVSTAKAALSRFKTAWRALHIRRTPGAILGVRYRLDGEVRKIYGRPRRFSAPPDNRILTGYVPITVDFNCATSFTYDDVESVVVLSLQQGSEGGFTFPTIFPTTTLPVGGSTQQAVVSGDAPATPIVRFNGPVENPTLESDAWVLTINRSIAADEYVEVDLRPWANTVLLNGQSSVAGDLGRHTYLADMILEPGRHDLTFRGAADSSAATCEVRWANAWNSI